ncbi:hypothetical protein FRB98_007216 [Tulasnella sp. 332]|nr:hypothetical protein FRB98_007216 [Tulasnella sp. 332]
MSPQTRQEVTNTVIGAIENHKVSWDQGLLATFLSNLADARQYDALEEVVDTYQKIIVIEHKTKIGAKWEKWRPSGIICSIMIKAYCQADRMQDALRWLKRYRHDWKDVTKRGLHPRPYITLIYGLAQRFKPFTDPRPAYTVVRQMIEDEVPMHIMVFNILMALETRRNNLRRVFALYRVLERRHPSLQADATTYATLFTAHKAWLRTRIPKKTPRPRPREIFRLMLHLHHNHTHGRPSYPSPYLTASTLNTIVSCFLLSKDYAAAIVALRTFAVCMLVTTTRTEWIVASTILRRIHGQLAKDNDAEYGQWVDRMRGRVMSAREKMEERKEMKELLISLKGLSHRVAKVLPPDELAAAHLALDSLIGHHGLGRRGALLENPRLTKLQMRSEAQVQLGRPMKLIQQAIFAAFPMGLSQADARDRFNGIMASVNSELLPPRLNRPGKRVGHPADNLRRLEKHRFARKL